MGKYRFTTDWFSMNIPVWEKMLAELDGTPCQLLEIGSWEGRSAMWMADNLLSDRDSRLECVDPWDSDYDSLFDANHAACERRLRVNKHKGYSYTVLPTLYPRAQVGPCLDFAYIDGNHEARCIVEDWVLTMPLMKAGGKICFDDYQWDNQLGSVHRTPDVGIDAIMNMWGDKVEVLYKGYQVWLRLK